MVAFPGSVETAPAWFLHWLDGLAPHIECVVATDQGERYSRHAYAVHPQNGSALGRAAGWISPRLSLRLQASYMHRRYRPALVQACFLDHAARWCSALPAAVPLVASGYGFDIFAAPIRFPARRHSYLELFRRCRLLWSPSPLTDEAICRLGCPEDKSRVLRLGVPPGSPRERPWSPAEPIRVLIAGRYQGKKGIADCLQVATREARNSKLEVTLIGWSQRGGEAEAAAVEAEVVELSRVATVRRLPRLDYQRFAAELRSQDIYLGGHRVAADGDAEGGYPIIVLEAAAAELVIVTRPHGEIPSILRDGVDCFLSLDDSVDALSGAFRSAIEARARWPAIGRSARNIVVAKFDASTLGVQFAALFQEVASGRTSDSARNQKADRPKTEDPNQKPRLKTSEGS